MFRQNPETPGKGQHVPMDEVIHRLGADQISGQQQPTLGAVVNGGGERPLEAPEKIVAVYFVEVDQQLLGRTGNGRASVPFRRQPQLGEVFQTPGKRRHDPASPAGALRTQRKRSAETFRRTEYRHLANFAPRPRRQHPAKLVDAVLRRSFGNHSGKCIHDLSPIPQISKRLCRCRKIIYRISHAFSSGDTL